jgi:hypothetical protein
MTDTPKYFIYPFGTAGDRATVPDPTQVSGVVSYQSGFPVGYQLIDTDPASLNIPRDEFNQLIYDITYAIQQLQQNGYPVFITTAMNGGTPFPYSANSFVRASDNNVYYSLVDNNTDTPPSSNWQIVINGNGVGGSILTGMMIDYWGTGLPSGYVWPNGQTIGNGSSNATGRANADTASLYSYFWALSPTLFPQFQSDGATPQARGVSSAADFAANYQMTLPDCLERVTAGLGTMGGVSDPNRLTVGGSGIAGATLGASGGVQTFALTTTNLASHVHGSSVMTVSAHTHTYSGSSGAAGGHTHTLNGAVDSVGSPPSAYLASHSISTAAISGSISAVGDHTHTFGGTTDTAAPGISGNTDATGSGTAHQNTQPTIICNKILKL